MCWEMGKRLGQARPGPDLTPTGTRHTAGSTEVDDVAVLLEHVDLLNSLDGLDVQLLEGGLELLVVGISGAVDLLDLAAGSALASIGGKTAC